ncbi:hypothetical protein Ancab_028034 [Ancistrocladus abbreviatus]
MCCSANLAISNGSYCSEVASINLQNPYNLSADPCGSSSGSTISVATNMVTVSIGTETDGSILCPSSYNSVVGIKPTIGLTSRSGVIPISPRQDTVGPICRTVTDAVHVLNAIVGFDKYDSKATKAAAEYIPVDGYTQFLKLDGLKGKTLGIVRYPFFNFPDGSLQGPIFKRHILTLRQKGAVFFLKGGVPALEPLTYDTRWHFANRQKRAVILDNLVIANIDTILTSHWELTALLAEFKLSLNLYLKELLVSRVRSLADVIAFNEKFAQVEMIKDYGQENFLAAEATDGVDTKVKQALSKLKELTRNGFEKLMMENELDAVVTPGSKFSTILAIGGFPGISVPAGYDENGVPFGICFGGLRGSEPELIEIAYAFEQATKIRTPPESLMIHRMSHVLEA